MPDTSTAAVPLPGLTAVLFRRAAGILLDHIAAMPPPWGDQQWRVVQTDTESLDGLAACTDPHPDDPTDARDCCSSTEPVGHEAVAAYVHLMQPAAALPLARLFEAYAELLAVDAAARIGLTEIFGASHLIDIARAIVGDRVDSPARWLLLAEQPGTPLPEETNNA